jgi:nitrous oxidase accessory protein NosD
MNYWSDYNATDNDGDSIGDTPYIINEDNQDNSPLMEPVELEVIPEFPSSVVLPPAMIVTIIMAVLRKRSI